MTVRERLETWRFRLLLKGAKVAGWSVRIGRALLAPAAAAAVSVAAGELAGHIFGRGLSPWVALLLGGGFGLWIAKELNSLPRRPVLRPGEYEDAQDL